MKINKVTILGRKVTVNLLMLSVISIIAVSCEKDDFEMNAEPANTQTQSVSMSTPPASSAAPAPGEKSITQIAIDAEFTELVGALVYVDEKLGAGLVDLFNGTGQYTVFAPTNEAFKKLYNLQNVKEITDLPAQLVYDVLLYHVVDGRRAANSVVPPTRSRTITTLLGETFSVNSSGVITDKAGQEVAIVAPNISATNGIIHIIDTVLLPLD